MPKRTDIPDPHRDEAPGVLRYRLDIAYDGTAYYGWQVQPQHRTIQQELELAIERICGERARVWGSGRTDQGVHARRQVAHVELQSPPAPAKLTRALNALIAPDVRVLSVRRAPPGFHARFSAKRKEYRYFIRNCDVLSPFDLRYRTQVRDALDIQAMQGAAAVLVGKHDFGAFTANPNRVVDTTVRELWELEILKRGTLITIRATAPGFLYKMVRSLAGFLIRVGQGAESARTAGEILDAKIRTARVPTAPPPGTLPLGRKLLSSRPARRSCPILPLHPGYTFGIFSGCKRGFYPHS